MGHPDEEEWRQEAAMSDWFEDQLQSQAHGQVFAFLAKYGDAVQDRVDTCAAEAASLLAAGFPGASLVRSAAGIEVTVRFFLARPLVLGAFRSDEWANTLTKRLLNNRTVEDRELLPGILRNWSVDLTALRLSDGSQLWETILRKVWVCRNNYVHAAATLTDDQASTALECLDRLLSDVVEPVARQLGFTRAATGRWSLVLSMPEQHHTLPTEYESASPFADHGA